MNRVNSPEHGKKENMQLRKLLSLFKLHVSMASMIPEKDGGRKAVPGRASVLASPVLLRLRERFGLARTLAFPNGRFRGIPHQT
jgi:hypothetical protein